MTRPQRIHPLAFAAAWISLAAGVSEARQLAPTAPASAAGRDAAPPASATARRPSIWWGDWDRDGLVDAFVVSADGSGRLLHQLGDRTFEDVTELAGLSSVTGAHMAAWGDADGDGRLDLFLPARRAESRLFVQGEDGVFADATATSGLPAYAEAEHAAWLDVDGDRRLDLHLVTAVDELVYRNEGRGTFRKLDLGLVPSLESLEVSADRSDDPLAPAGASGGPGAGGPSNPTFDIACVIGINDQANPSTCLRASSDPTLGQLYPLSNAWFVDSGSGNVGLGTLAPGERLDVAGNARVSGQLVSTAPTGAPLAVASSELVTNLNADLVDGLSASSFAQLPLTGADISDGTLSGDDVLDGSLTGADVADNSLTASDLATDSVGSAELAPDAVNSLHVLDDSITGADIVDGSILDLELGTDSVGSDELQANSVTSTAIAADAVTTTQIANDAVTGAKILNGTITGADISDGSIFGVELAPNSIVSSNILDETITANDLGLDSVGTDELQADSVTADELAPDSVGSSELQTDSVTADEIAIGAVTVAELAANAVNGAKIVDGTVLSGDIADGTVSAADLAVGAVGSAQVLDDSLTAVDLAIGSVTVAELASNAVNAAKVADGSLIGADIADGTLTAADLATGSVASDEVLDDALTAADLGTGSVASDEILDAAIAAADIATGAVGAAAILDGAIADADVSASAAIAGTKVDPDFGAQDVVTTGSASVGSTDFANLATVGFGVECDGSTAGLVAGTSSGSNTDGVRANTGTDGGFAVLAVNFATTGAQSRAVQAVTLSSSADAVFAGGGYAGTGPKYFVNPHPTDPMKEVRMVCLEGDESGTYFRGTAHTVDGTAVIDVPEVFRLVSSSERMTVQTTAVGAPAMLWVESQDLDRVVVRSDVDVEFHYFVNGVRRGYEDMQLIRENGSYVPTLDDVGKPYGTQYPEGHRRILVENGILNADFTPNEDTLARMMQELEAYRTREARLRAGEDGR